MADYFDDRAQEVSGDEDDESVDEETGEPRKKQSDTNGVNGHLEDSSEEEDDDDEDAEREVREGFIVDEEEEEERRRRKKKHKRPREVPELDEDDLDLELGELGDSFVEEPSRFKRLKRGHRDEGRDINEIFDDDDEDDDLRTRGQVGEFDDFIEEDDRGEDGELLDDLEVRRRPQKGPSGMSSLQYAGMDEADIEDMRAAFGDGTEYDWALELQEAAEDDTLDPEKELELKDVFEPSQLAERMLTDADQLIRQTDIPERFQILRKPFTKLDLTPEEAADRAKQETAYVSDMMLRKKRLDPEHVQPFRDLVSHILKFLNEENYEVPFIVQNRKDYLIHAVKVPIYPPPPEPEINYEVKATKLLQQADLWEILDLDLKFRALDEKRSAVKRTYQSLKTFMDLSDDVVDDLLPVAETTEEVQDLQDYINFQYSAQLKDIAATQPEVDGIQKRSKSLVGVFERLRAAQAYNVVKGFGITADSFAQSALEPSRRGYTDDPTERPDDMADRCIDEDYPTGVLVLKAAKAMFAEELTMSPRMKKLIRRTYFTESHFDCYRTDKGLRKIDEDHPYYEFKYLRGQSLANALRRPDLFLQMLKAEREGLIEVQFRLDNENRFKQNLAKILESDNFSEVADAWNSLRREVLDTALRKLQKPIIRQVKENLRTECENALARLCKDELYKKLDQAPYKPKDVPLGGEPRVLAVTNGGGSGSGGGNRDTIFWAAVEDSGRLMENGKFTDFRVGNAEKGIPDGKDVRHFVDLVERRSPDVIAISGFTPETRALYKDLQAVCEKYRLVSAEYTDENDNPVKDPLEVIMVNDEVARLYHTSDRSSLEHPGLPPLAKYCVAIARYLQSPLKEYVSLGRDLHSISFHPQQDLVPQEKLLKHLEVAIIDIVNMTGVRINDAVVDPYLANLLPYVCGLGPRKAASMIQAVNRNGGLVSSRQELVGDPESGKHQAVTAHVWANCASFLIVEYDEHEPTSEYLDSTRIHPEDYDLARKIAADGLELDEEDITAEQEEYGLSGVVRRMVREDKQDTLNLLVLEMYADQLEKIFHSKKRATLETIRAELLVPFEELRPEIAPMSTNEMFTMLTGETKDSLTEGMIVPVSVRKTFSDHIEVKLDCGIEGTIPEIEFPSGIGNGGTEARQVYHPHQIIQARLNFLERRRLTATLSLREDAIRRGYHKDIERMPGEWDDRQEEQDRRETMKRKEEVTGHIQRVIKHPLFRPFNAAQAEEFLGPQSRGDCVIRPSSKGLDHLAVTWKVSDNVFQHIDVLELDKENEFSVGRLLKVAGKYSYSDLDELIVNHVKAMAKKVDEIMTDERYQGGSKAETGKLQLENPVTIYRRSSLIPRTEKWLNAYMEANPRRSMYAFCINREFPGYFLLCFKASQAAKQSNWPVKIVPNAFQLQKNDYPTMMALKNGFKTLVQAQQANARRAY